MVMTQNNLRIYIKFDEQVAHEDDLYIQDKSEELDIQFDFK